MSDQECKCPPPGLPAWMGTFADLMSLLMCFFVLLLAFSEMDVLKFKKHCLLVKPMTNKLLQAKEMIAEAKRAQVVAQVEFHKRLDESNLILKDKINNNELGEIVYSTIEYSQQKKLPELHFKKWSQETNVFNYLGVHYVDLLYFLTEYKPKFVSAWGQKTYLNKRGIDTWDSIQVVIEWYKLKKSFVSTHITNWIDPNTSSAISDQKISIVGTNGRYSADQKNRGIETVNDTDGPSTLNPYFSQIYGDQKKGGVKFDGYGIRSIAQFCSDIIKLNEKTITLKSLDTIRPSFKNSLISTAVIEAVERSLRSENRKIKVIL